MGYVDQDAVQFDAFWDVHVRRTWSPFWRAVLLADSVMFISVGTVTVVDVEFFAPAASMQVMVNFVFEVSCFDTPEPNAVED